MKYAFDSDNYPSIIFLKLFFCKQGNENTKTQEVIEYQRI